MDFSDDDEDNLLAAVESYENNERRIDESVRFVTNEEFSEMEYEPQPDEKYLLILKEHFGHDSFRPLQWKIIRSIMLERRDCCAIMTTGYGKSLCYQFPAVFTNGITVVISPLISLMEDQVLALSVQNIKACFLGSAQKLKLYNDIVLGQYRVVYLTPEYVTGEVGSKLMKEIADQLTMVAIDEAHCVSSWGHDFRSAFRALSCIRSSIPDVPIMALTATATKSVLDDIIKVLRLKDPAKLCSGFDRPNLKLIVKPKISTWMDLHRYIRAYNEGSIIIYCLTRNETEEIEKLLRGHGVDCASYHAGLSLKSRRDVHERFVRDKVRIIIATVAFGMGIDKPDVRCVINYGASKEVESYYQVSVDALRVGISGRKAFILIFPIQEIGRAGRDGQPAQVITFFKREDFDFHMRLRVLSKNQFHINHMESLNKRFIEYLETSSCRRKFILSYFGDPAADKITPRLNCCDNCDAQLANPNSKIEYEELDDQGRYDFGPDTYLLLNTFMSLGFHSCLSRAILILRGSKNKEILTKFANNSWRGKGAKKPDEWWKELFDLLEANGLVLKTSFQLQNRVKVVITRVNVTDVGKQWLRGGMKLMLPPKKKMLAYLTRKEKPDRRILCARDIPNAPVSKRMRPTPSLLEEALLLTPTVQRTFEEELRKRLTQFRMQCANQLEVMPYMIVSEKCLQQMADNPPSALDQLSKYDGMSLNKISTFGEKFIAFIKTSLEDMKKDYPKANNINTNLDSLLNDDDEDDLLCNMSITSTETNQRTSSTKVDQQPSRAIDPHISLLDDDDDNDVLGNMPSSSQPRTGPSWLAKGTTREKSPSSPKAKKSRITNPTPPSLLYDDDDGDDVISKMPSSSASSTSSSSRSGPSWLTTRPTQSSNPIAKKPRNIKSIW